MSSYPRESKEFISIIATVDGIALTSEDAGHVAYAITAPNARPLEWVNVDTLETAIGFLIGPDSANDYSTLTRYPADYRVWVKDTDNPEIPVIDCGTFRIT